MICSSGICKSECEVDFPGTGTCGHTSDCDVTSDTYVIEAGLCPGKTEPDPTKDNVCCRPK